MVVSSQKSTRVCGGPLAGSASLPGWPERWTGIHTNWNDSTASPHGVVLDEELDSSVKIRKNGEPIFLACNGNSVINLCLISGKVTNQTFTLAADEDVELFNGPTNRWHTTVIVVRSYPSTTTFRSQRKPWIDKANWEEWRETFESKLELIQEDDPTALWLKLVKIVRKAIVSSIPFKTTDKQSKPFWNDELTISSHNLQCLRKKFKYHSNPSNGAKLIIAREFFKSPLSEQVVVGYSHGNRAQKKAKTFGGHITDSSNPGLKCSDQWKTTIKNTSAQSNKLLGNSGKRSLKLGSSNRKCSLEITKLTSMQQWPQQTSLIPRRTTIPSPKISPNANFSLL